MVAANVEVVAIAIEEAVATVVANVEAAAMATEKKEAEIEVVLVATEEKEAIEVVLVASAEVAEATETAALAEKEESEATEVVLVEAIEIEAMATMTEIVLLKPIETLDLTKKNLHLALTNQKEEKINSLILWIKILFSLGNLPNLISYFLSKVMKSN
jgi:hypothetical protein